MNRFKFWSRIEPIETGCWIFHGAPVAGGYVQIMVNGVRIYVHRLMYEIAHGPIQPEVEICHSCDVRNCVSPWHLFVGTHDDNMDDAARKRHMLKKLTVSDVRRIKQLIAAGWKDKLLGEAFGVSNRSINDIRHRKYHVHIA